jgi:hypothetical protein
MVKEMVGTWNLNCNCPGTWSAETYNFAIYLKYYIISIYNIIILYAKFTLHISQLHEQQTSFLLTSLNNIQALFGRFGALASLSFWAELEKNGAKAWNEKMLHHLSIKLNQKYNSCKT